MQMFGRSDLPPAPKVTGDLTARMALVSATTIVYTMEAAAAGTDRKQRRISNLEIHQRIDLIRTYRMVKVDPLPF